MKCPKCQHENVAEAKFCSICGCRLESVASSPTTQNQICSKCGAAIQTGAKFCTKCGMPVGTKVVQPEGKTMILYTPESKGADDRTIVLPSTVQTPLPPVIPVQDDIVPPAGSQDKKKDKQSNVGLIIAAVILGVAAIAGIVIALVFFLPHDTEVQKKSRKREETETEIASTEEDANVDSMQEMLENGQYTELIDTLLAIDDLEFYGDEETMREYMRQALVGHMNAAVSEALELAYAGDFEGAFGKIDAETAYRDSLKGLGRVYPFTEESTELNAGREQITSIYSNYVYENTQSRAEQRDLQGMETLLSQAAGRLSESEYNRISIQAYYLYVIKMVDQMHADGRDHYVIMDFIDDYFEKTNYHGYIMELWDNQNAESGRVNTWKTSITHANADGYLLPNSDARYIDRSELAGFSQFELYLARWEMYARHNRIFVDNALNTYFSKYSWYHGQADFMAFDDSSLNEYEKGNIRTIIEYEKSCGYR